MNIKRIRNKIFSISNTQKITKTMEMVAITKMKKMQKRLLVHQPYLNIIKEIIFHFVNNKIKYNNFFFQVRKKIKNIGIIILSSNRGLCGSLNNNIFKKVITILKKYSNQNIKCHLYIVGEKGSLFFHNTSIYSIDQKIYLKDDIQYFDLIDFIDMLIIKYKKQSIDKLFIVSNKFHNRILQTAECFQILPVIPKDFLGKKYTIYHCWDYLYESNSIETIDFILKKYILFQVFQFILENLVSEQAARMISMKTATDNSHNIIQELKILYNKIRQFSITQELIEIVSGANVIL